MKDHNYGFEALSQRYLKLSGKKKAPVQIDCDHRIDISSLLIKRYGIDYIELNKETESININWSKDTRDKGDHLNSFGTKKTTDFIARKIDSYGILEDRRNDENFKDWHELYEKYKAAERKHGI